MDINARRLALPIDYKGKRAPLLHRHRRSRARAARMHALAWVIALAALCSVGCFRVDFYEPALYVQNESDMIIQDVHLLEPAEIFWGSTLLRDPILPETERAIYFIEPRIYDVLLTNPDREQCVLYDVFLSAQEDYIWVVDQELLDNNCLPLEE